MARAEGQSIASACRRHINAAPRATPMIGLLFLTIGALLLVAYVWLVRTTFRYVKRRTGSYVYASLSILGILLLTVGDTLFNRWYVSDVLCEREDVGVKIFETVGLPAELWDKENNQPALPRDMRAGKPFQDRYIEVESNDRGGFWPFTYHSRLQFLVIDVKTERVLTQFINYIPSGGMWWMFPMAIFGNNPSVSWFFNRGSPRSCFPHSRDGIVAARRSAFELLPLSAKP